MIANNLHKYCNLIWRIKLNLLMFQLSYYVKTFKWQMALLWQTIYICCNIVTNSLRMLHINLSLCRVSCIYFTSKYWFNINLRKDNWMFQKCFDILMTILIKKPIFKMWFQQHFCQSYTYTRENITYYKHATTYERK